MITGCGTIDGRKVFVFSQDFTVFGGALGEVFGEKIVKVMDLRRDRGVPMIGINDCGGARIQEGVVSLAPTAGSSAQRARLRRDPADRAHHGPVRRRRGVLAPRITDFIVMVDKTSHMFITGPDVIKTVTGEDVKFEELGGARPTTSKSGVAHFVDDDEETRSTRFATCCPSCPSNNLEDPP